MAKASGSGMPVLRMLLQNIFLNPFSLNNSMSPRHINLKRMPNALIHEKSPYLRQHADNPVNWLPWGAAAFEQARAEDKPIFLSIGYSTCHWCHVMAHESFESASTAAILNRNFVCIKLDREERPDVDRIYMLFVQATTGSGGWPMSVFLTPTLKPFFGGTYFPPDNRYGRPGFPTLLGYIAETWKNDRAKIEESGDSVTDQLRQLSASASNSVDLDQDLFDSAFSPFRRSFDSRNGGFGTAPKFPRPVVLNYLLRFHFLKNNEEALDMASATLTAMAAGGMHDQLGGGFHRYSVDERWFVPHFEKMLYDQSQLAISYLESFQITGNIEHATSARRIFAYVLRDLTSPQGAFYSAEDADSSDPAHPGHSGEGAFYIWSKSEIDKLIPDSSLEVCRYFGVEAEGNVENDPHAEFTGRNILYVANPTLPSPPEAALAILLATRSLRPRPGRDSKILTAWNAQMISAFATGYLVLQDATYLAAAEKAYAWVWSTLFVPETNQLWRRYCDGEAAIPAFLDDYAFLGHAALSLFEATGHPSYLRNGLLLARQISIRFEDPAGAFYSTEAAASDLLLRMKDDYDGAEPSGNSLATDLFLRLAHLLGDSSLTPHALRSLAASAAKTKAQPTMAPQLLCALARSFTPPEHLIVRVADEASAQAPQVLEVLQKSRKTFQPFLTSFALSDAAAASLADISPFLAGLKREKRITIYHCQNLTCQLPQAID
jgi:uncharacterized protein YyaL (SSP411 family)